LPDLGRSKRDVIAGDLWTVAALAGCDPKRFTAGKKTAFRGVGPDTLVKVTKQLKTMSENWSAPLGVDR
jgi:hypothetical protein